jgi:hypothetical protein
MGAPLWEFKTHASSVAEPAIAPPCCAKKHISAIHGGRINAIVLIFLVSRNIEENSSGF